MARIIARVLALGAVAVSVAVAATPAKATTVRQLKTVQDGTCVRPTSNPTDLRAQNCSTKPTKARDWEVIIVSSNCQIAVSVSMVTDTASSPATSTGIPCGSYGIATPANA
jgi:hypothetical protein